MGTGWRLQSPTGDWIEPEPGTYSVRIPEGTYKILAREHSGLFSDSYYNGTSFSDAQEVTINDDLTDINFILKEGSVSTFTIRWKIRMRIPLQVLGFIFMMGIMNTEDLVSRRCKKTDLETTP